MSSRLALYRQLLADSAYVDVAYDAVTGGLMATHIEHRFDHRLGDYEKAVQRLLFSKGHEVILDSEVAPEGVKTPDGFLNEEPFDIKTVLGTGKNNVKNKFNEAHSQGCAHIVLYYPIASLYDIDVVWHGHRKYLGVLVKDGKEDILEHIWVVVGNDLRILK